MSEIEDKPEKMRAAPPCYAVLYAALVPVARKHGYALAIHGSMTRDCDLLAVPWVDDAGDALEMIMEIREVTESVFINHEFDHLLSNGDVMEKPHGRRAYVLHLTNKGCDGPYLDISVMPKSEKIKD